MRQALPGVIVAAFFAGIGAGAGSTAGAAGASACGGISSGSTGCAAQAASRLVDAIKRTRFTGNLPRGLQML